MACLFGNPNPTKIVCTLGPATDTEEMIAALADAGMDVVRLNFSHGDHNTHSKVIRRVRKVARENDCEIAILADLQGPKIRVGKLVDGDPVILNSGDNVIIDVEAEKGDAHRLSTTYPELAHDVRSGERILINDGLVELRVLRTTDTTVVCDIVYGGPVREHAGINLPGARISAPTMTDKDLRDLQFAVEQGADYIALSFVRSAEDIRKVKRAIADLGAETPVVGKLEKPEALEELEEIVSVSDVIMVARGDLGVETSAGKVPVLQKRIIVECSRQRVPVITATQMLESMTNNPRPTRAEASDVANAVFDGTDALMLSGETAIGKYPAETVKTMRTIATIAEKELRRSDATAAAPLVGMDFLDFADSVARAAADTADILNAEVIVAFTQSGSTARLVSKCRPRMPIIAATPLPETARRCSLYWAVQPLLIEPVNDTDEMITNVDVQLRGLEICKEGDVIIITAGTPIGRRGTTNTMKVHVIGS
ncbi:MAG: pyruvate kinase [Armatimonadia bacterium]|nr:pyruvate kinase [Armatimonadia bacterium]